MLRIVHLFILYSEYLTFFTSLDKKLPLKSDLQYNFEYYSRITFTFTKDIFQHVLLKNQVTF